VIMMSSEVLLTELGRIIKAFATVVVKFV